MGPLADGVSDDELTLAAACIREPFKLAPKWPTPVLQGQLSAYLALPIHDSLRPVRETINKIQPPTCRP